MARGAIQPVRQVIAQRGWTLVEVADAIGVDRNHFLSTVRGLAYPRDDVRERLPKYLGVPLEALYDEDRLAERYSGPRGRRGGRRVGANELQFSDEAIDRAIAFLRATREGACQDDR